MDIRLKTVRSDAVYRKMLAAAPEKRDDIFRYELMSPFQRKWDCYRIPLKAKHEGGYDIVMACRMMGLLTASRFDEDTVAQVAALEDETLWRRCEDAVRGSLERFEDEGIELFEREYVFSLLLADGANIYTKMNENYCGDGGIPGFVMAWLIPGESTISRIHAALAHETDHNVRFQHQKWHDDITLGEMLVSEGLAENFAAEMFGEELTGPWVTRTDWDKDGKYIKDKIRPALGVQGLEQLNAYLYGDEMAAVQGCEPAGLPYCAGYALGYRLVRHYLDKTGISGAKATILPAEQILEDSEDFWDDR